MNICKDYLPLHAMFAIPERLYHVNQCGQEIEFNAADELRRILVVNKGSIQILEYHAEVNESVKMNAGDILIVPPNTPLHIVFPKKESADCLLFDFRTAGTGESLLIGSSLLILRRQPIAANAARQIADQWSKQHRVPWQLQAQFVDLMRQLEDISKTMPKEPINWLNDSLRYIFANYKEELGREKLARRAGVSPEHYSRVFRQRTGFTLTEYITLIRVRKAQELLLSQSTATLDQIAQETGFREGLYLSRRFKQMTGSPPKLYREAPIHAAALNINHSAALWALGIQPRWGIFANWHTQKYGAKAAQCATHVVNNNYKTYDEILLPDVILSYQLQHHAIHLLKLAPVIQLPHKQLDWKDQFRSIAELVNKSELAEEILLPLEEKINRFSEKLRDNYGSSRKAIVWEFGDDMAYAIAGCNGRGAQLIYGDLGFQIPQSLIDQSLLEHGFIKVSIEQLSGYDADFIFFTGAPSTKQANFTLNMTMQSNAWRRLTAVQTGRVYMLNNSDLFWGYDPLSSKDQLEALQQALLPE